MMEELLGAFLVIEGGASMLFSLDQRVLVNIGRGIEILIGLWLIRRGENYHRIKAELRYERAGKLSNGRRRRQAA